MFDGGYPSLIMFQIISLESSRCRLSAILVAGMPSRVQHMNRQMAQVCCCHDLAGQLWTAVDKRTITAEAVVLNHEMTEFCFLSMEIKY